MSTKALSEAQIKNNMDRMYKWTRHIYDASRKYYLLGRDHLIDKIQGTDKDIICEVGCGTARNLICIKKSYPQSTVLGIDASDEMLKTASNAIQKAGLQEDLSIAQAYSQSFAPKSLFALKKKPNKIVFSYSLSIIPPWKESINHALTLLPKGGEIHIIDFGSQKELPAPFRAFLFWWLKMFHVYYKPEIEDYLGDLAHNKKGTLRFESLYGGYCYYAIFKKN